MAEIGKRISVTLSVTSRNEPRHKHGPLHAVSSGSGASPKDVHATKKSLKHPRKVNGEEKERKRAQRETERKRESVCEYTGV